MNFFSTWVHPTGKAKVHPSPATAHRKVREQDRSKYPKRPFRFFASKTEWTEDGQRKARARVKRYVRAHAHEGENLQQVLADAPRHIREYARLA